MLTGFERSRFLEYTIKKAVFPPGTQTPTSPCRRKGRLPAGKRSLLRVVTPSENGADYHRPCWIPFCNGMVTSLIVAPYRRKPVSRGRNVNCCESKYSDNVQKNPLILERKGE